MLRYALIATLLLAAPMLAQDTPAPAAESPVVDNPTPDQAAEPAPQPLVPPSTFHPTAPAEWEVRAECLMLLVPQKLMLQVTAALGDEKTASAAWDKLVKQVDTGGVKLLADLIATGNSGCRLSGECTEAYQYVTEFDPPHFPDKVPETNALEFLKAWPLIGVTPRAFSQQKLGQTLAIEPVVMKGGKLISFAAEIEHIRLLRTDQHDAGRLPNGERLSVQQPVFHTMRSVSTATIRSGQRILFAVHRAPAPEEGYELFLLTLRADKVRESQ